MSARGCAARSRRPGGSGTVLLMFGIHVATGRLLAQARCVFIVEKGQEGVARSSDDRRGLVQQKAREDACTSSGRPVALAVVLGKPEVPAFVVFSVEIDGDRKLPMPGAVVVAVGPVLRGRSTGHAFA